MKVFPRSGLIALVLGDAFLRSGLLALDLGEGFLRSGFLALDSGEDFPSSVRAGITDLLVLRERDLSGCFLFHFNDDGVSFQIAFLYVLAELLHLFAKFLHFASEIFTPFLHISSELFHVHISETVQ